MGYICLVVLLVYLPILCCHLLDSCADTVDTDASTGGALPDRTTVCQGLYLSDTVCVRGGGVLGIKGDVLGGEGGGTGGEGVVTVGYDPPLALVCDSRLRLLDGCDRVEELCRCKLRPGLALDGNKGVFGGL